VPRVLQRESLLAALPDGCGRSARMLPVERAHSCRRAAVAVAIAIAIAQTTTRSG